MALGTATAPYELRFDAGRICLDLLATTPPRERLDSVGACCAPGSPAPDSSRRTPSWPTPTPPGWPPSANCATSIGTVGAAAGRHPRAAGVRPRARPRQRRSPPPRPRPRAPSATQDGALVRRVGRPARLRRAARGRRPGRRGPAHRPRRAGGAAAVRRGQLPHRLPRHLPGAQEALVLQ